MRRFVILGHKAAISPEFNLSDLPGSAGRLDVLCRAIGAAFLLSHDLRRDVEVTLLLQDRVQLRLLGKPLRHLNPDERSPPSLLKHALEKLGEEEVRSTPGIFIAQRSLPSILDRLWQLQAHPVILHEQGIPIDSFSIPSNPAFFLSDHSDFSADDEKALSRLPRVSLGRQGLHTSQCITILHYLLDRRDQDESEDLVLCHKVWAETQAKLIQGLLADFHIPSNLVTQVPPSVLPMAINGLAEVQIKVCLRDLARAKEIIADYFQEEPLSESIPE